MWYFLIASFLFILGSVVGSFLNVLVARSLKHHSWVWGRSRCDKCHKSIKWYDNIPLLSFLWLHGRCRYCHKPIDRTHVLFEVLTGALFVWWYSFGFVFFHLSSTPLALLQPLFWLTVGLVLLIIVVVDIRYYLIPDISVAILLGLTLFYRAFLILYGAHRGEDLAMSLLAAGAVGLLFWALHAATRGKGMGFGDVKLVLPLALLTGWPGVLVLILASFVSGAAVGIGLVLSGKRRMKQPIPFGPFLVLGCLIALVWGDSLITWYLNLLG